jgi:hypothetical protein
MKLNLNSKIRYLSGAFVFLILCVSLYFLLQSKRYLVLDKDSLIVMDTWTRKTFYMNPPIYNPESNKGDKKISSGPEIDNPINYTPEISETSLHFKKEKIKILYDSLKANPNITGLPDDILVFESKLQKPETLKVLYESLKCNPHITYLPATYNDFVISLTE